MHAWNQTTEFMYYHYFHYVISFKIKLSTKRTLSSFHVYYNIIIYFPISLDTPTYMYMAWWNRNGNTRMLLLTSMYDGKLPFLKCPASLFNLCAFTTALVGKGRQP